MRFRKIALLVAFLGAGAGLDAAYRVRNHLGAGPMGWRILGIDNDGPSFEFTQEITEPISPKTLVEVSNAFGGVAIRQGGPSGQVTVRLRKVVFQPTEEKARAFAERLTVRKSTEGGALRLSTNRSDLEHETNGRDVGFETHFEVLAPDALSVRVINEHGDVAVQDVEGVFVSNGHGNVTLERAGGSAEITCAHGDIVAKEIKETLKIAASHGDVEASDVGRAATIASENGDVKVSRVGSLEANLRQGDLVVENVGGELTVRGEHTEVRASDIKGKALIETSFRDVELARIGGEATLKTSHSSIKAQQIQGALFAEAAYNDITASDIAGPVEVTVDHGDFHGERLSKGVRVKSPGGDVDLASFQGPIDIESERGAVQLTPGNAIVEPISVTTKYGDITLIVPSGSRFDLDAASATGEVRVRDIRDLALSAASISSKDGETSASGKSAGKVGGGGKVVRLSALHGDVTLRSSSSSSGE